MEKRVGSVNSKITEAVEGIDYAKDMCVEDAHKSRLDEIISRLQDLDRYSEHLYDKAYNIKARLIGDTPIEDKCINEKAGDDSKLTRAENYLSSIGINLDRISEELRLLDNTI